MLRPPAVLGLDDESPQRHPAQEAADDGGLVPPREVDECVFRPARGVDPARALERRRGVAVRACGDEWPAGLPHVVVQDGLEPPVRAEAPGPPA